MTNAYWFRPKSFGYGATPICWQGWALAVGYGAILAAAVAVVLRTPSLRDSVAAWIGFLVVMLVTTIALALISKAKTDGEWRWRSGRDQL